MLEKDNKNEINKITWKSLLKNVSLSSRKYYCSELFPGDEEEILRCIRPHVYCKYQCLKRISRIENIINYHCFVDCIRESKIEKQIVAVQPLQQPAGNFLKFFPKSGKKCDYKPSGELIFVPAKIIKIKSINKLKFAELEYLLPDSSKRHVFVRFPNPNLLRCGKALKGRLDCDKEDKTKKET